MRLIEPMIQEFAQEAATTRKLIALVPEGKNDWKPHEKSMGMMALVSHMVDSLGWVDEMLDTDVFEMDPAAYQPYQAATVAEALEAFDAKVAHVKVRLAPEEDGHLMMPWKMVANGQTAFELPRIVVIRNFLISHLIHHRAQLGLYLRLNDIALPSVYGPTADEGM